MTPFLLQLQFVTLVTPLKQCNNVTSVTKSRYCEESNARRGNLPLTITLLMQENSFLPLFAAKK